jgi:hypothetical protein
MKYTTAKTILKLYKNEGRFTRKKSRVKATQDQSFSSSSFIQAKMKDMLLTMSLHEKCGDTNPASPPNQVEFQTTLKQWFWSNSITEHLQKQE